VGTPTYAADLAEAIFHIINDALYKEHNGIYHFSNEGVCSWYDFAKEIAYLGDNICDIQPCHSDEFPSKVKRPAFSVLDKTKLKQDFDFVVPYWKDSLIKCINRLK
jgi:dTDP-4-dehydrorhamnose reductase